MTTWRRMASYLWALVSALWTWFWSAPRMSSVSRSAYSPLVEVVSRAMSPTFSTLTGMTSWWVMVCGNSVQAWPSARVSSPEATAWRTGQSGV